jgi:RND family efflux transporter MFP subunit
VGGQPIAEIIRLDRMKMQVDLTGAELALMKTGVQADVEVDAVMDHTYSATVDHVAPKADPVTRKFQVELHVDNRDGRLLSGMFGRCRLHCGSRVDVIRIPRDAVTSRFGADFCYVVDATADPPSAELRRIRTRDIPGQPESVDVIEGLSPGELYVTHRDRRLADGQAIRFDAPVSLTSAE